MNLFNTTSEEDQQDMEESSEKILDMIRAVSHQIANEAVAAMKLPEEKQNEGRRLMASAIQEDFTIAWYKLSSQLLVAILKRQIKHDLGVD